MKISFPPRFFIINHVSFIFYQKDLQWRLYSLSYCSLLPLPTKSILLNPVPALWDAILIFLLSRYIYKSTGADFKEFAHNHPSNTFFLSFRNKNCDQCKEQLYMPIKLSHKYKEYEDVYIPPFPPQERVVCYLWSFIVAILVKVHYLGCWRQFRVELLVQRRPWVLRLGDAFILPSNK